MAREIILTDYCDVCLYEHQRQVEASFSGPVILGGLKRVLSLCPTHQEELLDPLGRVVQQWGQPLEPETTGVRGRPRPETLQTCPVCLKPCDNRQALASHVRRTHKQSITDIEADLPSKGRFYQCAHCDRPPFATTQQLGAHVRNQHPEPKKRRRTPSSVTRP